MEKQWLTLFLGGSKVTADGDCSCEIKRCLLLGRKVNQLREYITLPTKVHLVKAIVFPVVMYGCESWTIKKAEHQSTDAFVWYWKRLFRVPWTVWSSNQSVLKEISPEWIFIGRTDAEVETLIIWLPDGKNCVGKDLDVGKDWRQEEKGMTEAEMVGWHHQLNGHEFG